MILSENRFPLSGSGSQARLHSPDAAQTRVGWRRRRV